MEPLAWTGGIQDATATLCGELPPESSSPSASEVLWGLQVASFTARFGPRGVPWRLRHIAGTFVIAEGALHLIPLAATSVEGCPSGFHAEPIGRLG
jgi:hypothetical protein